jgi:Na+-driven multidrug efflux pump
MGGRDGALTAALAYSNVVFGGAVAYWLYNTLSSVVRGSGNMGLPASAMALSATIYLALSPALVMGWGPFPALGVAGAAAASLGSFVLASGMLFVYLVSGRGLVRLSLLQHRLRWALFWEILRVGAPGSLNTVMTNLTIVLVTGLVGPFGAHALAGYGMAARLEYLQIPLVFGLGSALVTLVGTNAGANSIDGPSTSPGLAPARRQHHGHAGRRRAVSHGWIGLFSTDPRSSRSADAISGSSGRPAASSVSASLSTSRHPGDAKRPLLAGFTRL